MNALVYVIPVTKPMCGYAVCVVTPEPDGGIYQSRITWSLVDQERAESAARSFNGLDDTFKRIK